jgi:tripartite-type tricarboxylate transporter receptor subunit TctC
VSSRLAAFASAILALAAITTTAPAQDFPNRPIRIVIAFPAGGPTDFVGRLVADKAKDILGQPVIIENKPGANGALGADSVAKAAPDGYTLFLSTVGAVAITPHMRTDLPYDTLRDFAPVTMVVGNTTVLVVRSDSPYKSAKELTAAAKEKPGQLAFASTGVGSTTHLAMELYQTAAGIKFVHVPYRGAAPALTDLLGGQVVAFFADVPVLMPQILAGKVRPLAAASDKRNPKLPDVRTLAEEGYADTSSGNWYGLLAPAKSPPAVIAKLNDAFVKAVNDPAIKQKLIDSGAVPVADKPEEFGATQGRAREVGQGGARQGNQGDELEVRHRRCLPSPRGEGGERSEPGGEKPPFLAGLSPPPRSARTLPSRGGMRPPELKQR